MDIKKESGSFKIAPGFCPDCGTILPLCTENEDEEEITCYSCERVWCADESESETLEGVFGNMDLNYRVKFVNRSTCKTSNEGEDDDEETPDGPIVERQCTQCKNNKMSYATLQLRSLDEGQTVFYTCTKCKFKEVENS